MAFMVPQKPTSHPSSAENDGEGASFRGPVTSQLYLSSGGEGAAVARRALDKGVVLRRIRHRKRVNQIQSALQSLIRAAPEPSEKNREDATWLEDAFSSP